MKKQTAIILMTNPPKWWGNLKKFCDDMGLKYNTYSKKKFPFKVKNLGEVFKEEKQ